MKVLSCLYGSNEFYSKQIIASNLYIYIYIYIYIYKFFYLF
jgi:hypothetical protein